MKLRRPKFSLLFLGGMLLISMGFASSFGLQPTEALVPLFAVVGALAVITMSGSGSGSKGLLWNRPEKTPCLRQQAVPCFPGPTVTGTLRREGETAPSGAGRP
jgi:hypothetical protein